MNNVHIITMNSTASYIYSYLMSLITKPKVIIQTFAQMLSGIS